MGMAKQLYNDLKHYGLGVWLDTESLLPVDRWKDKIQDAIENSNYFIAYSLIKALLGYFLIESSIKRDNFGIKILKKGVDFD